MTIQIFNNHKTNTLWLTTLSILLLMSTTFTIALAQGSEKENYPAHIKLALNAYSFNDMLTGNRQKDNKPTLTLPELLDWCATQNIEAVDLTGYYFPGYPGVPTDEYIYELKRKAFKLGIDISGTGIKNNFASPDPAVRAADVKRAKEWIIVASKLGAPVLRLFAGEIPKGYENKWDEVAGWMIDCYKECAAFGAQHGVIIGIQNHGDMLQTADQCIKVVKAVNSKWAGLILDTGNFKVKDPYVDIEAVIPYTVNWQVKESVFGIGSDVATDVPRLMKILKKSGYRGYIPIETLYVKNKPYDPYGLVPALLHELKVAQDSEFK
ncbi:sugar phosphate isomerase/epimerase family protein (plasmid) [Spirosoma sp. SC4-14]|uniref:sugar phosphate isomerase/epimerase family protein n=1 Tax=Spirosoma sp. SC4-14 TaxID=3128900 RepID=UPI0030CB83A5